MDLSGTTHTDTTGGAISVRRTFTDVSDQIDQAGSTATLTLTDRAITTYVGNQHGATAIWTSTRSDGADAALTVTSVGINATAYVRSTTAPTIAGGSNVADFIISRATFATNTVGTGPVTYDGTTHGGGSDAVTATSAGDSSRTTDTGNHTAIIISQASLPVIVTSDLMLVNQRGDVEEDDNGDRDGSSSPPLTGMVNRVSFTGDTTCKTTEGNTLAITLSGSVNAASRVGVYPIIAAIASAARADQVQSTPANMYVVTVAQDSGAATKTPPSRTKRATPS